MIKPWTRLERGEILENYARVLDERRKLLREGDVEGARREKHRADSLKAAYFDRLPRVVMSCCPYDGRHLVRTFDPYGLDGLWWSPEATPPELPSCLHFCVLTGALNLAGRPPSAGSFEVHPGPQAPFIIPRLAQMPGMIAVIGHLRMETGYDAYPIAYFSERRPPAEELTAEWRRKTFKFTTAAGEAGWTVPNDPWDFELLPWLKEGKIRWCAPVSGNQELSSDPPELCPYLNLSGARERMVIERNRAWGRGLPSGKPPLVVE